MVNLTINGTPVQAKEGTTLLDAAKNIGIDLTTLCHHAELEPYGGCRLCSVEISSNGRNWVTTACTYPVEEGIAVKTDSPRALSTRKMMAELILARTPQVPAIQRLAASLDIQAPRFTTDKPDETCVLCGLCVRTCHEIAGKDILGMVEHGPDRRVTMAFDTYNATTCDTCNKCITYCPTGAITQLEGLPLGRRVYQAAKQWIRARQAVQYGALAIFAILFLTTSQTFWGNSSLVSIFSRLDPLQAIMSSIADRKLILTYLPALLIIAATLIFGRVWCGWICPLGAILESFGPKGTRKVAGWYRHIKYFILFTILLMALFGSLAFMYFDPITILIRGLADPISLVQSIITSPGIRIFTLVSMIPLLLVLGLNFVERHFWCRYLCPLGAMVGLGSKFAWVRWRVNEVSCVKCGDCVKACPMGAINPETIKQDPAECVMCMDCAALCPKTAITFGKQPTPRWHHEFDPSRREFIGSAATAAAGLVLFNVPFAKQPAPDLLRPPGVRTKEEEFLTECIRCGQCVEACPGNALHPVWNGMSWESLWTPALVATLGGCQYDCTRCGQVCPSGAIPNLALAEKCKQVIGIAALDEPLCINCMVCEKACPTQAIERTEIRKEGKTKPLPVIVTDKCIGCGLCEFRCPAPPAIKVYTPGNIPTARQKT